MTVQRVAHWVDARIVAGQRDAAGAGLQPDDAAVVGGLANAAA